MNLAHDYQVEVRWTDTLGAGTSTYDAYSREHTVELPGKMSFKASADASFRGDVSLANPEDLLVASLAQCHLLSYLAVCAREEVVVLAYADRATGRMALNGGGGGRFETVTLHPRVVVTTPFMIERALELHHRAHEMCFIASSVNFPVRCEPSATVA